MDPNLSMDTQIHNMCKTAWVNLYKTSKIRLFLTSDQLKTVIHAYVTSKLDSNNGLLASIPQKSLNKLQWVQNAAVRLISESKKHKHFIPILRELHLLPISYCIRYKIMVLVYKALEGSGPAYLQELLKTYKPNRSLRSSLLAMPKTRLKSFGDRGFYAVAPLQWNHLPQDIGCSESLLSFKSCLKTHCLCLRLWFLNSSTFLVLLITLSVFSFTFISLIQELIFTDCLSLTLTV